MAERVSITFGLYLTGGVPDGVPLWREPPREDRQASAPRDDAKPVPPAKGDG